MQHVHQEPLPEKLCKDFFRATGKVQPPPQQICVTAPSSPTLSLGGALCFPADPAGVKNKTAASPLLWDLIPPPHLFSLFHFKAFSPPKLHLLWQGVVVSSYKPVITRQEWLLEWIFLGVQHYRNTWKLGCARIYPL